MLESLAIIIAAIITVVGNVIVAKIVATSRKNDQNREK
jgi:hypothetical protein